jgi:predicted amidohydrolase YtcJ
MSNQTADLIAYNGKIATQNEQRSMVEAVAVLDGKFLAVGTDREVMAWRADPAHQSKQADRHSRPE